LSCTGVNPSSCAGAHPARGRCGASGGGGSVGGAASGSMAAPMGGWTGGEGGALAAARRGLAAAAARRGGAAPRGRREAGLARRWGAGRGPRRARRRLAAAQPARRCRPMAAARRGRSTRRRATAAEDAAAGAHRVTGAEDACARLTPSPSPPPGEVADLRASARKRPRPASAARRCPINNPPPRLPAGADPRSPAPPGWAPPASPFSLLEEATWADPWLTLVACALLNKATAGAVRRVLPRLLQAAPTAEAAAAADPATLAPILRPLGLQTQRATTVVRLSAAFVQSGWADPAELPGVGPYASAAYWIFCAGQWEAFIGSASPSDKDLAAYVRFLEATGGRGAGFARETLPWVGKRA